MVDKKDANGKERRLRSRDWFDAPGDPTMAALYLERYLNFGLTLAELHSNRPIIGMDYNLFIRHSGGLDNPSGSAEFEGRAYSAFRAAFDVARELDYDGGDRDRQRFSAKVIERVLTRLEKLDERNLDYLMNRLQQLAA